MISGIFHEGSGLGNQLFRYITVRTLAEDKGFEWGMMNPQYFKGNFFTKFENREMTWHDQEWDEKKIVENGVDIRSYDPEINFVQDNTCIDGEFQDDKYWRHELPEIDKWLAVEPLEVGRKCVIGFRGGEYYSDPNLGLPKSYYEEAMHEIRIFDPMIIFEVHTDDPAMARQFFLDLPIIENKKISHSLNENMGYNWRAMRYAQYAIISNSSFYILPRLLRHQDGNALTIAPRYWARYNTKVWALPSNYYSCFSYI